ncbi:homeobox KN domain-containing protein [Lipomyces doorenjongii]
MSTATVSPTTQLPSLQEVLPEFLSARSSESPSHIPAARPAYAHEFEVAAAGNASPLVYAESASSDGLYRGASLSPQESIYGYSLTSGSIPQKSFSVSSASSMSSASSVSSGMSPIEYQPRSSIFYSGAGAGSGAEEYQQYQGRLKEMYGPKRNCVSAYSPPPSAAGYYTSAASYAPDAAYLQAAAFGPTSTSDLIQQQQQQQHQHQQQLSVRSVSGRHHTHQHQSSAHAQKKRRGNLPKHVTDILRNWLNAHVQHPYPTEEEKTTFMQQTGLTMNQISNWFINARRRRLPTLNKEAAAAAAATAAIVHRSLSANDKSAIPSTL